MWKDALKLTRELWAAFWLGFFRKDICCLYLHFLCVCVRVCACVLRNGHIWHVKPWLSSVVYLQSSLGKTLPSVEYSAAQLAWETNMVRCCSPFKTDLGPYFVPNGFATRWQQSVIKSLNTHCLCRVGLPLTVPPEDQKDPFAHLACAAGLYYGLIVFPSSSQMLLRFDVDIQNNKC